MHDWDGVAQKWSDKRKLFSRRRAPTIALHCERIQSTFESIYMRSSITSVVDWFSGKYCSPHAFAVSRTIRLTKEETNSFTASAHTLLRTHTLRLLNAIFLVSDYSAELLAFTIQLNYIFGCILTTILDNSFYIYYCSQWTNITTHSHNHSFVCLSSLSLSLQRARENLLDVVLPINLALWA